jgi:hypothetical protein
MNMDFSKPSVFFLRGENKFNLRGSDKGRDIALRCPRRRAQRQATESDGRNKATPCNQLRRDPARTAQRAIPTAEFIFSRVRG